MDCSPYRQWHEPFEQVTACQHESELILELGIQSLQLVGGIGFAFGERCKVEFLDKLNQLLAVKLFTRTGFVFNKNTTVFGVDDGAFYIRMRHAGLVDARLVFRFKSVRPRTKADTPRLVVNNSGMHIKYLTVSW